eukprot:Skav214739  [mRNA]  locus=scaffold3176:114189:115631:+ [translate_table: standard]
MASELPVLWLSQDVAGLARQATQDQKLALLDDLDKLLGVSGPRPPVVEEEVDYFLLKGRISNSNLSRLQRRLRARLGRDGCSSWSESSYSARTATDTPKDRLCSSARCRPEIPPAAHLQREDELLRWSQIAKLATKEAEIEKAQKKEAKQVAQKEMRAFLQLQVDQKNLRQKQAAEDELEFFQLQKADLERWKEEEVRQAQNRLQQMQLVMRDREVHTEEELRKREAERKRRSSEDRRLILRAAKELELEKQAVEEKRHERRQAHTALVHLEGLQEKKGKARAQRIAEERQFVEEYSKFLEAQEARSKASKPRIRDQTPAAPPRAKRKGEEVYYDPDLVMKIRNEAMARAEEAEVSKQEQLKMQRHQNQAFLFKQIAEREESRKRDIEEQKNHQKAVAEAAAKEHEMAEKQRIQSLKMKNLEYRLELDRQISLKKMMQQVQEDQMSGAEKAMNRRYVLEAMEKTSSTTSTTGNETAGCKL